MTRAYTRGKTLLSAALIEGFTIANGHTTSSADRGGGVYCYYGGTVSRCIVRDNAEH